MQLIAQSYLISKHIIDSVIPLISPNTESIIDLGLDCSHKILEINTFSFFFIKIGLL